MARPKPKKTDENQLKHRLRAFQLLTHIYFHQHDFFVQDGDMKVTFKTERITRLLRCDSRSLHRMLAWLVDKEYLADHKISYGKVQVQLIFPKQIEDVRKASMTMWSDEISDVNKLSQNGKNDTVDMEAVADECLAEIANIDLQDDTTIEQDLKKQDWLELLPDGSYKKYKGTGPVTDTSAPPFDNNLPASPATTWNPKTMRFE